MGIATVTLPVTWSNGFFADAVKDNDKNGIAYFSAITGTSTLSLYSAGSTYPEKDNIFWWCIGY